MSDWKEYHEDSMGRTHCVEDLHAKLKAQSNRIEKLRGVLKKITRWREDAHDYDDDMDQPPRDFDVEDVMAIESFAQSQLEWDE